VTTRIAFLVTSILATMPVPAAFADDSDSEDLPCCPAGDDGRPCYVDDNDVVGYRRCDRYGAWGRNLLDPYVFFDLGMNERTFGSTATPPSVVPAARTVGPKPPTAGKGSTSTALLFDERMGFGLSRHLYGAVDFELGNFGNLDSLDTSTPDLVVDGLASLGLRGGLGPFALAAEVAGGVMEYTFAWERDGHVDGMLEARGRLDLWLSPWCSVGGVVGTSLIAQGDWMAGVYLGVHTWSYAGNRQ